MALDFNFTLVDSAATPASSFTITQTPASPLPGEMVHFHTRGTGGDLGLATAIELEPHTAWLEHTFEDPGAGFEMPVVPTAIANPFSNPNKGYAANTGHAWAAAGTFTNTLRSWIFGGSVYTQTSTTTVADPDAIVWDAEYYVDINGDATGFPAESGTVTHILSQAALLALDNTAGSTDKVRWHFRAGVAQTLLLTGVTDQIRLKGALHYFVPFGSGKVELNLDATSHFELVGFFLTVTAGQRIVFNNFEVEGYYDPANGYFDKARIRFFHSGQINTQISMYRTIGARLEILQSVSTGSANDGIDFGSFGCRGIDCQDFMLYCGGGRNISVIGFDSQMIQNTPRGDGKTGLQADFTDHAIWRWDGAHHVAVQGCRHTGGGPGGWSFYGTDRAIQTWGRCHQHVSNVANSLACIVGNFVRGGAIVSVGNHTPATFTQTVAVRTLVACNTVDFSDAQGTEMVKCGSAGGQYVVGNVGYVPLGAYASAQGNIAVYRQTEQEAVADAIWRLPNVIEDNVLVSDQRTSEFQSAGVRDILASETDVQNGAVFNEARNLLVGDDHKNSGTLTPSAQVARGAQFRPITGTAADTLISGGQPVNIDGTANIGAVTQTVAGPFAVSGVDVSASAVTWTTGPTIALVQGRTGQIFPTDIGDFDPVYGLASLEYRWYLNGTDQSSATRSLLHPVQILSDYTSSDVLTLHLTGTNRSGQTVTRIAAGYTVP